MSDISATAPPPVPAFRDRSAGLVVFGVVELLLAAGCLLMTGLLVLGLALQSAAPHPAGEMSPEALIPSFLVYPLLAIFFACMGVGSMQGRRWARALMLVVSWLWLVTGLGTLVAIPVILPTMTEALGPAVDRSLQAIVLLVTMATILVVMVALPAAFVLFYRSPHVKATCEWRDPKVRWTDRCPLPVLGLSLVLGYCAVAFLALAFSLPLLVFGVVLTGPARWAACLVAAGAAAYLARATYRLRPAGWWGTAAFVGLGLVSGIVTLARGNLGGLLGDTYRDMGMPEPQLRATLALFESPAFQHFVIAAGTVSTVGVVAFLLYVRRFFPRAAPA